MTDQPSPKPNNNIEQSIPKPKNNSDYRSFSNSKTKG